MLADAGLFVLSRFQQSATPAWDSAC